MVDFANIVKQLFLLISHYLSFPLAPRIHSSSQLPLLMSQSIGPGLRDILLFIVIIGVDVVIFISPSAVVPVVVTNVDVAEVIFPFTVASVVGTVIDIVALVPLSVVVSAVVIEANVVKLLLPAVVIFAAVIMIDVVDNWVDVEPLVMVSEVVFTVVIGIGIVTKEFTKCDQFRRKRRIWSNLLGKSSMEKFIFVQGVRSF